MQQVISELNDMLNNMPKVLPKQPTFLEIAGFPHYENVCSNILQFYFNPNNPHKLNHKLIDALIECSGSSISYGNDIEIIDILREVTTDSGLRIDIIIITNKWIIGIENKIYHHLNNDLKDYSNHLEKRYHNKEIVKIILSLYESPNTTNDFVNVTYKQLIKQLEKNVSLKEIATQNQYDIFFYQFIETIKRMYMPNPITENEIIFLITNKDRIDQLQEMEDRFSNYISHRISNICNQFKETETMKIFIYEKRIIVFQCLFGNVTYKLECVITKEGIYITICNLQNTVNYDELNKIKYIQERGITSLEKYPDHSRLILKKFVDHFTDDNQIINELKIILKKYHV